MSSELLELGEKKKPLSLLGFPGGSDGKASARNVEDPGFDPWVGKIPWRSKWQPTPVIFPGKPTDRGTWQSTV